MYEVIASLDSLRYIIKLASKLLSSKRNYEDTKRAFSLEDSPARRALVKSLALVYSWLSLLTISNFQLRLDSGIREIFACGIQNVGKFACGIRNPENFTCGIRTPGFWNLESHYQLESGIQNPSSTDKYWNPVIVIRNPQRGVQNPRLSWIPSHGAIRGQWKNGGRRLYSHKL